MLREMLDAVGRCLMAVAAAMLPRRLWPRWNGWLPMEAGALLASLLTFLGAFAVGIPCFLRYAAHAGSAVADTMLTTAVAVNQGRAPAGAMPGSYAVSMFALPGFLFFTPLGWLTLYLFFSGLVRSIACAAGEAHGDPLIGLVDHVATTRLGRRRQRIAAATRAAREGPAVADVLLTGREGGAPEAAYVLVASRVKDGWERGTFVITPDAWYRLGDPFDRRFADGLRRVYPLIVPGEAEAIRRQVRYELPPLSEAYPAAGRPAWRTSA
jgi:hypothetical protein